MKIHVDFPGGGTFDYESTPMPERRFRVVCALIAAALYAELAVGITALCGLAGAGVVAVATFLCALIYATR